MFDFSNLVGKQFLSRYDNEPLMTVHAAYFHDGQVKLIVSRPGGPLYETNVESLRSEGPNADF
mgnify:CR=1 FL=1